MSRIEKYTLLAGCIPQVVHPRRPFASLILQFIQDFRRALLTTATVSAEWKALAFLLRPSHFHIHGRIPQAELRGCSDVPH